MDTTTSRRSILAGAAAVPASPLPAVAIASPNDDAELIALSQQLKPIMAHWQKSFAAFPYNKLSTIAPTRPKAAQSAVASTIWVAISLPFRNLIISCRYRRRHQPLFRVTRTLFLLTALMMVPMGVCHG